MRSTSSTSRADRGFTLIEALIASTLMLLLFGVVASAFGPTLRATARSLTQAELQQEVDTALRFVEADVKRTVGGGIGLLPAEADKPQQPVALGLVRLEGVASDGRQVWETQAVVYVWDRGSGRLLRRLYPPQPPAGLDVPFSPGHPVQLATDALLRIASERGDAVRVLASGVRRFEVGHGGKGTAIEPPLTLTLELARTPPGAQDAEIWTGTRRVAFRLSRTGG